MSDKLARPKAVSRKLSTISEIAREAGVSVETIKFYQSYGILTVPKAAGPQGRKYAPSQLAKLVFIRLAKALGFSLAEIKELKALSTRDDRTCNDVRNTLAAKVAALDVTIAELTEAREKLVVLRDGCQGGDKRFTRCPIAGGTRFGLRPDCSAHGHAGDVGEGHVDGDGEGDGEGEGEDEGEGGAAGETMLVAK